jgi:hypothetical protein
MEFEQNSYLRRRTLSLQAESVTRQAPLARFLLRGTTPEVTAVSADPFSLLGRRDQMWYIRRNTGGWGSGGMCKIIAPEGSLGPRNQDAVRLGFRSDSAG